MASPISNESSLVNHNRAQEKKEIINLSELDELIQKKDYGSIIRNQELFFQAFCTAYNNHKDPSKRKIFSVFCENQQLKILGTEHLIDQIKRVVEVIRNIVLEGLEDKQKDIIIAPIKIACDFYFRKASDASDSIDLRGWLHDPNKISGFMYIDYLKPSLGDFAVMIGAVYTEILMKQRMTNRKETQEIKAIKLEWLPEILSNENTERPPREGFEKRFFYRMYQNGTLCDLKLIAKNGDIDVHGLLLYTYGEGVLQKMLTGGMKESKNKIFNFDQYDYDTIKTFVDYIYLSHEEFFEKVIKDNICDLGQLLDFAHTYQIKTLIDICTNLINKVYTIEDLENIQSMAKRYNNYQLKRLALILKVPEKIKKEL